MAPTSPGDGRTVVLATNNAKKLVELRRLVAAAGADVRVLGLGDLPPYPEPAETERTFVGNALLKARAAVAARDDAARQEVAALMRSIGLRDARIDALP